MDGSGAGYAVAGEAELRFLMDVAGAGLLSAHGQACQDGSSFLFLMSAYVSFVVLKESGALKLSMAC